MTYQGKITKNKKHLGRIYSILNNQIALISDINKTLNSNIEVSDYIKLEDILNITKEINESLYNDKCNIENIIENKIISIYGEMSSIILYRYNNTTIEFGFTNNYKLRKHKKIIIDLTKDNKPELYYLLKEEIFNLLRLNETYNYFVKQYSENVRPINSSLRVNISLFNISLYIPKQNSFYDKSLEIKYSGYEDKFYLKGDNYLLNCIKGQELVLLKSIYIQEKDCPEFLKNIIKEKNRKKYKIKKI